MGCTWQAMLGSNTQQLVRAQSPGLALHCGRERQVPLQVPKQAQRKHLSRARFIYGSRAFTSQSARLLGLCFRAKSLRQVLQ